MTQPLPSDIFKCGQVLNNTYEIEGVLGRGGTGEVYRARNQITGRIVAVKALNRVMSANDAYLELMRREEEMRAISSDAVVRYTDCARSDEGHVYLVMDYVDGTPLSAWLERGGAGAGDLLTVARRVAEGLVATHARNIVHRDLSPDNIVLRRDDPAEAVIIDFGIARDTSAGARTIVGQSFAGKYEYAAPEQLHGRAEPRSDLYALGALLLATFRGAVPEVGRNPGEIMALKQQPLDTAGVPEPLRGLIDALTNPDPARRLPGAAALLAEIDRFAAPDEPPRAGRWRWLFLPGAAVALLGLAWALGFLSPAPPSPEPVLELAADGAVPSPDPAAAAPAAGATPETTPPPSPGLPSTGLPSPELPSVEAIRAALGPLTLCGAFDVTATGTEVDVRGRAPDDATAAAIDTAVATFLAGRTPRVDVETLNPPICTVLAVLPPPADSPVGIVLGHADRDTPNLTGEYRSGEHPLVSLVLPDTMTDGYLWAGIVDVSGQTLALLPNDTRASGAIADYPSTGTGRRLLPLPAGLTASEPWGKAMVLAIETDRPLFAAPRPPGESAGALAAALATARKNGTRIRSVSEQVMVSRK